MMREDDGNEAHVEKAHVETKEELEGREVNKEACAAAAWLVRGRGSVQKSG